MKFDSIMVLKENEFQCANCKGVFEKGWSDEEAYAETESNFGIPVTEDNKSGLAVICDDCYKEFMGWYEETYKT